MNEKGKKINKNDSSIMPRVLETFDFRPFKFFFFSSSPSSSSFIVSSSSFFLLFILLPLHLFLFFPFFFFLFFVFSNAMLIAYSSFMSCWCYVFFEVLHNDQSGQFCWQTLMYRSFFSSFLSSSFSSYSTVSTWCHIALAVHFFVGFD